MKWLLIIFGALALIKGIWMIAWSKSASAALVKWTNMPNFLLKTASVVFFLFGIFCIWMAIKQVNPKIAATLIIGTIFMIAGIVYHSRETLKYILSPWMKGGKKWMVAWGAVSLIISAILLWIGIT